MAAEPAANEKNPGPPLSNHDAFWAGSTEELKEQETALKRKLVIFGTDVAQIPCFRNSFLYGILSGFGLGVGHFAMTSRVAAATNFGFYSYVAVTFCYYVHCSYSYSKTKFEYQKIQYAMSRGIESLGTEGGLKIKAADITVPNLPMDKTGDSGTS